MEKLICNKYNYILYTHAKCACVTMKQIFISHCNGCNVEDVFGVSNIHNMAINKSGNISKNKQYFSWTVVRNPFHRLVSCYFDKIYHDSNGRNKKLYIPNLSFKDWIIKLQNKKYTNDHWAKYQKLLKNVKLDKICRLETINEDLKFVFDKVGAPFIEIPNTKKTLKKYDKKWFEYYDKESAEIVAKLYKQDFERFQYNPNLDFYL